MMELDTKPILQAGSSQPVHQHAYQVPLGQAQPYSYYSPAPAPVAGGAAAAAHPMPPAQMGAAPQYPMNMAAAAAPAASGDPASLAAALATAGASGDAGASSAAGQRALCDSCGVRRADIRAPCGHAFHARCLYQLPLVRCPVCCADANAGEGLEILSVEAYSDRPADEMAVGMEEAEQLRTGRWHTYETLYAQMVVEDFEAGTLPISEGTKLGAFLCSMLVCSPTRLGKKLRIGKKYYQSSGVRPDNAAAIARHTERMRRMSEIEEMFLMCESQTSRGAVNAARLSERIQTEWRERFIARAHSLNQRLKNAWHWNTSRRKVTVSAGAITKLLSSMSSQQDFSLNPLAPLFLVQHSSNAEAAFRALSTDLAGLLAMSSDQNGHSMKLFSPPMAGASAAGGQANPAAAATVAAAAAALLQQQANAAASAAAAPGQGGASSRPAGLDGRSDSFASGLAAAMGGGGGASGWPAPAQQAAASIAPPPGSNWEDVSEHSASGGEGNANGTLDDDVIGEVDHDLWSSLGDNLASLGYQNSLLAEDHAVDTPRSSITEDNTTGMGPSMGQQPTSAPLDGQLGGAADGLIDGWPEEHLGHQQRQTSPTNNVAMRSGKEAATAAAVAAAALAGVGGGSAAEADGSAAAAASGTSAAAGGGDDGHSSHRFQDFIGKFLEQVPFEAVDVWVPLSRQGDQTGGVVLFHAGYFTNTPELQEWGNYSTNFSFNQGEGLPGRVFYSNSSEWQEDVQATGQNIFLRLHGARRLGIRTTFGVPVVSRRGVTFVIVFYTRHTVSVDLALREFIEKTVKQWRFDATFDAE